MVLVNSGKLTDHLKDVERMAEQRMDTLLPQLMKAAGVTEELKARDQMSWVGLVLLFFHTSRCGTFQQLKNTVYRIIFGKNTKAYPLPSS